MSSVRLQMCVLLTIMSYVIETFWIYDLILFKSSLSRYELYDYLQQNMTPHENAYVSFAHGTITDILFE